MERSQEGDDFKGRNYDYLKTPENVFQKIKAERQVERQAERQTETKVSDNPVYGANPAPSRELFVNSFFRLPEKFDDSGFKPNQRALNSISFFINKGYSLNAAVGITANLAIESANFSDDVIFGNRRGDGGKAVGLAQWHPDRWEDGSNYLQDLGVDPFSFEGQLMMVDHEFKNSEKGAAGYLSKARDHIESATIVNRRYERSADTSTKRESYADNLYKYYNDYKLNNTKQVGSVTEKPNNIENLTYGQTGVNNAPNLHSLEPMKTEQDLFNDLYENNTPRKQNENVYEIQNPHESQPFLEDIGEFGFDQAILPQKMFIDAIDKQGSQLINSTKGIVNFANDQKDKVGLAVSKGIDVLNNTLSTSRNNENLENYERQINKSNYKRRSLEGNNGSILNY